MAINREEKTIYRVKQSFQSPPRKTKKFIYHTRQIGKISHLREKGSCPTNHVDKSSLGGLRGRGGVPGGWWGWGWGEINDDFPNCN